MTSNVARRFSMRGFFCFAEVGYGAPGGGEATTWQRRTMAARLAPGRGGAS
jgi:hypothetical protein